MGVPCVKSAMNELAKIVKLALPLLATPGAPMEDRDLLHLRAVSVAKVLRCYRGDLCRELLSVPQLTAGTTLAADPTFHEIVKSGDNPDSRRLTCKFLSG